MESYEHPIVIEEGRSRKRIRNAENTKRGRAKKQRYSARLLPKMPKCKHSGKTFQCEDIQETDVIKFAESFYSSNNKLSLDTFILTYCTVVQPKEIRRRLHGPAKNISICYYIRNQHGKLKRICQKSFRAILNIGKDRVQRVCKRHLITGKAPVENRGGDRRSFGNSNRKMAVINFIKKFKTLEVHYCRSKISRRQYLPGSLSVNKLFLMYDADTAEKHLKVKCSYFRHIFNTNFNISFKSPSSDICSMCLMYKEMITYEKDDTKKQKLMVESTIHKRRGKAFFNLLKEERPDMITISFDCQKNMVLPKVPDQAAYYSRQLYLYNLGMVQGSSKTSLTKDNVFLYIWGEHERSKGSNEIASAMFHRLCNLDLSHIKKIRLVADGCGGQNKNFIMMTMLVKWFANYAPSNINELEMIFPVAGHSFIPPDRVFAQIEKAVKARECIISPDEYLEIFKNFGTVIHLGSNECPVQDWKSASHFAVKPPGSWHFPFNKSKRFIFSKKKTTINIRGEIYYNSRLNIGKSVMKKGKRVDNIQPLDVPAGVHIKKEKLRDVNNLLSKHFGQNWRAMQSLTFYKDVLDRTYPTIDLNHIDQICEFTEEQIGCRV